MPVDQTERPTVLDLFCGAAGGWSLGLHRAGFQTIAACEIDPWRRETFGRRFPKVRLYDDVRTLTAARLHDDLGFLPEIVVGSPPCQDASTANTKGRGLDGERTGLFSEWLRLVDEIRPRWACAENVPGIRTRGVDRVLASLEEINYAAWPVVVGAVHAGAPHKRSRVWIIAADADELGVREQPGRRGRPRRACSPIAANPSHTDGEHWAMGRRAAAHAGTDAAGRTSRAGPDIALSESCSSSGDAECQGLAIREGERGDTRPQLAALERAVGAGGMLWNGGPSRHFRVADGLPAGMARRCISAFGDAVVPQITEAIGRTLIAVSHTLGEEIR